MILDELTNHIADIIHTGNPAQRKALIEALVAEVKITGPHTIIPVFRIPQPPATNTTITENTEAVAAPPATTASERMVRTMVEPVGRLGIEPRTQGFSDRRCGCSWIALITCGFRDCKRSLSVVVFGYLEVFCDHKVSNDQPLNGPLTILDAGGRVVFRRSGLARPHGSPGAALDDTGAYVTRLCPRADVW
jgi:hypothetical protein